MFTMSMIGNIKKYAILVLIILIGGAIFGVYYKIDKEFKERDVIITNLKLDLGSAHEKLTIANTKIILEKANTTHLTTLIYENNRRIADLNSKHTIAVKELNEWRKKKPEVKYVEKVKEVIVNKNYSGSTCEEGLNLNKKISEIKYEDL